MYKRFKPFEVPRPWSDIINNSSLIFPEFLWSFPWTNHEQNIEEGRHEREEQNSKYDAGPGQDPGAPSLLTKTNGPRHCQMDDGHQDWQKTCLDRFILLGSEFRCKGLAHQ